MTSPFGDRLHAACEALGAPAVVGIDPHLGKTPGLERGWPAPAGRRAAARAVRDWALEVLDGLAGVVPAVKPQSAFFEALGAGGFEALEDVCEGARDRGLLVILDAKRGDIGSTSEAYAYAGLDPDGPFGADALTVAPYLGPDGLAPFVARCEAGKGIFVLVRTSNPGGTAWQVGAGMAAPVAAWVAAEASRTAGASGWGAVGAVVGATQGGELARWREAMPQAWLLLPGYGAQGATAADVAPVLGRGGLVSASRSVLFGELPDLDLASGVRGRALRLVEELRLHLPRGGA